MRSIRARLSGYGCGMREPGTKVVARHEHAVKVDGKSFIVEEIHWNDTDGLSFHVWTDDDRLLTENEAFDYMPTDEQIRDLLDEDAMEE